jgi:hypothetical protein
LERVGVRRKRGNSISTILNFIATYGNPIKPFPNLKVTYGN